MIDTDHPSAIRLHAGVRTQMLEEQVEALEQRLQALEARITMPNLYRCTDGVVEALDIEASSPQQAAEIFAGSFNVRDYPNQVIVTDEAGKKHHYLINLRYSAALV